MAIDVFKYEDSEGIDKIASKIKDWETVKDYGIPIGAGLLGAAGAYALARAPIWGTSIPYFKNLRKTFGNKVSAIFFKNDRRINLSKEKILSGYDNVITAKPGELVNLKRREHGFTFDYRPDPVSAAASRQTTLGISAFGAPGNFMTGMHMLDPKLFPKTKVLKPFSPEFHKKPTLEEFRKTIQESLEPGDIKNTVIKIQTGASGIVTPFKTEEVLKSPERFFKKYLSLVKSRGIPMQPVYIQQEIPGEVYRATIIGNRVVPGSVVKRYGIMENVLDSVIPARRKTVSHIEKKLDKLVKSKTSGFTRLQQHSINKNNIPISNPDVIVNMDSAGRIKDLKVIDVNIGGLGGNVNTSKNPVGNWAVTRALTGKQPRILAGAGALGVGTASGVGATFIRKKNKEA